MKLIIDIPAEIYQEALRAGYSHLYDEEVADAVANGTPLKSHGRLIDADELIRQYNLDEATKYGNKNAKQQAHSYSTMMLYEIADMIDDAPTIIEADKEDTHDH